MDASRIRINDAKCDPKGRLWAGSLTSDFREGRLWVAVTGWGVVRRHLPNRKLLGQVEISTPGATSCAFGGSGGADLFITSRSGRMPEVARTIGPTGAPATPFAG